MNGDVGFSNLQVQTVSSQPKLKEENVNIICADQTLQYEKGSRVSLLIECISEIETR